MSLFPKFGGQSCSGAGLEMLPPVASDWRHASILLGFAASTKNEGIAMLVSAAIALLIIRPRDVIRLWLSVAIAAPWLILRATHYLPTDIVVDPSQLAPSGVVE